MRYENEEPGLFKSGQARICALCLGDINPKEQCGYVFDEIACTECWQPKVMEPIHDDLRALSGEREDWDISEYDEWED